MMFKRSVSEAAQQIMRREVWAAEINGYEVVYSEDGGHPRLCIYKAASGSLRMGIIECRPRNVADLEQFALDAQSLFSAIASGLREAGKVDLRSKWERLEDEINKSREDFVRGLMS